MLFFSCRWFELFGGRFYRFKKIDELQAITAANILRYFHIKCIEKRVLLVDTMCY